MDEYYKASLTTGCSYSLVGKAYTNVQGLERCILPPDWVDVNPEWRVVGHRMATDSSETQPRHLQIRTDGSCGPYQKLGQQPDPHENCYRVERELGLFRPRSSNSLSSTGKSGKAQFSTLTPLSELNQSVQTKYQI